MMSSGRKFPLRSSDEDAFKVDEATTLESQATEDMIEDDDADIVIPSSDATGKMRRMSIGRKVVLRSSDGYDFEVDEAVALESQMIESMIKDNDNDHIILPLPNVTSKILSKVIEYCKKHVETTKSEDRSSAAEDDLKAWDAEFVKVDRDTLFDLILAANYLNNKNLLDLTCQTVTDMIKGKTPEEIRKAFNLENMVFTPEEEEKVRRENQWAFE